MIAIRSTWGFESANLIDIMIEDGETATAIKSNENCWPRRLFHVYRKILDFVLLPVSVLLGSVSVRLFALVGQHALLIHDEYCY